MKDYNTTNTGTGIYNWCYTNLVDNNISYGIWQFSFLINKPEAHRAKLVSLHEKLSYLISWTDKVPLINKF